MMDTRNTYTTGDIAKICGVHFRTVIRWIERGYLKAYQLPGRGDNRIQHKDLVSFLQENKIPVPQELHSVEQTSRVLIVEDDPRAAKNMERILMRGGFETAIAENGFMAGLMLSDFAPAVMTLDLRMPGLGGLEVIRMVRSTEKEKPVQILVVSAMGSDELEEALRAGANDVLAKPFRQQQFLEKVQMLAQIH